LPEGMEFTAIPVEIDIIYVPPLDSIPGDIEVGCFVSLLTGIKGKQKREFFEESGLGDLRRKRFNQLEGTRGLRVILSVLPILDAEVYLLYDLIRGMSFEGLFLLKETMEKLVKQEATVLFLTTEHTVTNNQTGKN
jgi:ABC-type multidrug transport system ATPase subunit